MNINDILNIKYSTRNLSDEEFERALPQLAKELANKSYLFNYSGEEIQKDWKRLKNYSNDNFFTSSVTRPGIKICETFFPNFFTIENNKGQSFAKFWNEESLKKVLRWNRKSHSTPYMSEIRRGVYFCNGLTKNTMYRPHIAKMICDYYQAKEVLDPCMGWGGRMLGAVASGAKYTSFEPSFVTFRGNLTIAKVFNFSKDVALYNIGSEAMDVFIGSNEYDLIITSPPYFNLEIYSHEKTQSENKYDSYEDWKNLWLKEVIKKSTSLLKKEGVSCWNVHNVDNMSMIDDIREIHDELGFVEDKVFGLTSSARQANQNINKNKKTNDLTVCYKRK